MSADRLVEPESALVVAAHPDDAELAAGGTIALLARQGWCVRYVVVTDGSRGSRGPPLPPALCADLRAGEQREAARRLGVREVVFLGLRDGDLRYTSALVGAIAGELLAFRPAAVYTHDPEPIVIEGARLNHPDHRVSDLATVHAASSSRWCHPEQVLVSRREPLRRELYLWGTNAPSVDVEVTETIDTRVAALAAHRSQFRDDDIEAARRRGRGGQRRAWERFRRVVLTG